MLEWSFWKRRLIVFVWTDPVWCHISYSTYPVSDAISYFCCFRISVWTGENYSSTLRVDAYLFIQKSPCSKISSEYMWKRPYLMCIVRPLSCHYHPCKSNLRSISNRIDICTIDKKCPAKYFLKNWHVSAIRHIFSIWRKEAYPKRLFFLTLFDIHPTISFPFFLMEKRHVLADRFTGSNKEVSTPYNSWFRSWAIFLRRPKARKI